MKKITKGKDFIMGVAELKSIQVKEGVGKDCRRLWKLNGDQICFVNNVKVSEHTSSEKLPVGYFIEKRFSTIKTLDGNWVLVPGFDTYGFATYSCEELLGDVATKSDNEKSFWIDEESHLVYIEDSFVLNDGPRSIDLSHLSFKNSFMPIFLVDKKMLTVGYWHNGDFHQANGSEMNTTKINSLVYSVLAS